MKVYPIFLAHGGCPHRCLFCAQRRSVGQPARLDPVEVHQTLDEMLPEKGDGEIAFFGGTFTLLPSGLQLELLGIARQFVTAGRVAGIRVSTRPDGLEATQVNLLAGQRVTTVEIGCQSFDPNVLSASRRGHAADEIAPSVARCRTVGFQVGLQLMPGLPGGGPDEAFASLSAALLLKPDFLRIYPALVIEGAGLEQLWRDGCYQPWTLDQAVEVCAELLLTARRAEVPVIRIGLQHDPTLDRYLLAGPAHPAFGQLVRSRLWWRALNALPRQGGDVLVHPADLADAVGHGGANRLAVAAAPFLKTLRAEADVPRGGLRYNGITWPVDELAQEGIVYAA